MKNLNLKITFATIVVTLLNGCSTFQSPYSNTQTWTQGERPSYSIAQITNRDREDCASPDNCQPIGKIILTRPDSNASFQFFVANGPNNTIGVITCASPAEVARALSVSGNVLLSASKSGTGVVGVSANASGSQSLSEAITVAASQDAATHYVAASSFYNCLAYANGMYGPVGNSDTVRTAISVQQVIFSKAVEVQQAVGSGGSAKPAAIAAPPAAPAGTPVAQAISGLPGSALVTFNAVSDATGYTVTPSPSDGTDTHKGTSTTSHVITGLKSGVAYTFTVTASNSAGPSKASAASNGISAN